MMSLDNGVNCGCFWSYDDVDRWRGLRFDIALWSFERCIVVVGNVVAISSLVGGEDRRDEAYTPLWRGCVVETITPICCLHVWML